MTEHINAGALDAASEIAPPRGSDGKQREYASTERKVRNGFVLLLTFLLLIAAVSYYSVDNLTDNAAWVAHSHEVSNGLDRLLLATTEAETAQRGYLISGDASYLESYAQAEVAAAKAQHSLEALTADNANQQRRLSSVGKSFEERMKVSRERIEMRRTFGLEAMQRLESIEQGRRLQEHLRVEIAGVRQAEAELLKQREVRTRRSTFITRFVIVGGGLLTLALMSLSMFFIRRDFSSRRAENKRQEQAIAKAKAELEARVGERTMELAQANQSLRRSELRFRAMIEYSGDAISMVGADNRILYMSPAVLAVEGFTPEELVGKPGLRELHPDDVAYIENVREKLRRNPGLPIPLTWRRRHKLGHWIWLEGVVTNLVDDPSVGALVANYRNVTERKAVESKLQSQLARLALLSQITRAIGERQDSHSIFQVVVRSLEEQLPVDFACLCVYRSESNSLVVVNAGTGNPALARLLALGEHASLHVDQNGLSHCVRGELVYEPNLEVVSAPFPQRLLSAGLGAFVAAPLLVENKVFGVLIAARASFYSFSSGECEFLRQLSEHVALSAHQSQLHASLQSAYEELRQTQQAVMQQERLRVLGQMASGIAHDINNAISPISLYTESLLECEPNLSERGRGFLQVIRRAIQDVAETVGRMREFYRQREFDIPLVPLQLNALAPQVVELTRARWSDIPQRRGILIEMRTEFAADLPLVMGVESELREALTNLIFNAADAMPQGGVLTLRTCRQALGDGTERVRLEVIDTGVGMSEETRRHCLELFFTTKGERGTGLGLAMVYGITQRHNADLDIESAPGQGTRIILTFDAALEVPALGVMEPMPLPAGLRILVIDDDPIILESMQVVLESDGLVVATAAGGRLGIDTFERALSERQPFDIVITDLGMPNVDGCEVARNIKASSPTTPVIMLTGWGQRMVSEGDTPEQVDKVISKPPRPRELRAVIAEFAARKAGARPS